MGIYVYYFMAMNGTIAWYLPKSYQFLGWYQVIVSEFQLAKG